MFIIKTHAKVKSYYKTEYKDYAGILLLFGSGQLILVLISNFIFRTPFLLVKFLGLFPIEINSFMPVMFSATTVLSWIAVFISMLAGTLTVIAFCAMYNNQENGEKGGGY